jgi:hypothetical protein
MHTEFSSAELKGTGCFRDVGVDRKAKLKLTFEETGFEVVNRIHPAKKYNPMTFFNEHDN